MLLESRERGGKDDAKGLDLGNWKDGVSINTDEEDCGWPSSLCLAFE